MPMLATLKGNDLMTNYTSLTRFHRRITKIDSFEKLNSLDVIESLANYINNLQVNQLMSEIFNDPDLGQYTERMIAESLDSYRGEAKVLSISQDSSDDETWLNIKNMHIGFNEKDFELIQLQQFYDFEVIMEDKHDKAPFLCDMNKAIKEKTLWCLIQGETRRSLCSRTPCALQWHSRNQSWHFTTLP